MKLECGRVFEAWDPVFRCVRTGACQLDAGHDGRCEMSPEWGRERGREL